TQTVVKHESQETGHDQPEDFLEQEEQQTGGHDCGKPGQNAGRGVAAHTVGRCCSCNTSLRERRQTVRDNSKRIFTPIPRSRSSSKKNSFRNKARICVGSRATAR